MVTLRKISFPPSLKHVIYGLIVAGCLIMRAYAAYQLQITEAEASILLKPLYASEILVKDLSIWNQILAIPMIQFFGKGNLAVRFWVLLAGCAIPLLPLFFEKEIGERSALIWAVFLALDPFQIANSLQIHGNTFAFLFFLLCAGFSLRGKYLFALLCLLALTISRNGGWTAIFFTLATIGFSVIRKEKKLVVEAIIHAESQIKKDLKKIPFFMFLAVAIMILLKIRIGDPLNGLLVSVGKWGKPYAINSKPPLFPITLTAYLPLGVICSILLPREERRKKIHAYLHFWIILSLLLISIYPGHKLLDLGWTSLAVWLLGAMNLDDFLEQVKSLPRQNLAYLLILLCVLINISITGSGVIYQVHLGMNPLSQLLTLAVITVVFCLLLLLLAFNETFTKAWLLFQIALLMLGCSFQFSSSWRTSGISTDSSQEILWEGYFQDAELVHKVIQNSDLKKIDGDLDNFVAFIGYDHPAVIWAVQKVIPIVETPYYLPEEEPALIITNNDFSVDSIKNMGSYFGQKFISGSYPLWIWEPIKSIANSDFWYWWWFRMGQVFKENSIIWVNKDIF